MAPSLTFAKICDEVIEEMETEDKGLRALFDDAPSLDSLITLLIEAGSEMASGRAGDSVRPGGESLQGVCFVKDSKATLEKAWQISGLPRPKEPSS